MDSNTTATPLNHTDNQPQTVLLSFPFIIQRTNHKQHFSTPSQFFNRTGNRPLPALLNRNLSRLVLVAVALPGGLAAPRLAVLPDALPVFLRRGQVGAVFVGALAARFGPGARVGIDGLGPPAVKVRLRCRKKGIQKAKRSLRLGYWQRRNDPTAFDHRTDLWLFHPGHRSTEIYIGVDERTGRRRRPDGGDEKDRDERRNRELHLSACGRMKRRERILCHFLANLI